MLKNRIIFSFIIISFSLGLFSQDNFKGEKIDLNAYLSHEQGKVIDDSFKDYQAFYIPMSDLYQYADTRNDLIEFNLKLDSFDWDMVLERNDMRSKSMQTRVATDNGISEFPRKKASTYAGFLGNETNSSLRLSIHKNMIQGSIKEGNETYFIEPLSRYAEGADENIIIVYNTSDVIQPEEALCGVTADFIKNHGHNHQGGTYVHKGSEREETGNCKTAKIALAADGSMTLTHGSVANVEAYILDVMNIVEGFYLDTDINIAYEVVDIFISDHPDNDPNWAIGSTNFPDFLEDFSSWGNGGGFATNDYAVASLWTDRDFDGGAVGLAWLGTVCSPGFDTFGRFNVLQDGMSLSLLGVVQAHELGHNWNAEHAPDDETPNNDYIMSPSVGFGPNDQWHPQTITTIVDFKNNEANCLDDTCEPEGPVPPDCDFAANATTVVEGGTVDFTDQSTGDPTSWNWTFDGGTPGTSTDQNPTGIQYNNVGTYTVTLEATNAEGSCTTTLTIEVVEPGAPGGCDTLTNIFPGEDITAYNIGDGYYPGHNGFGIARFADPYTAPGATNVVRLLVPVAIADPGTGAATVDFHVYGDNGGEPGGVLGSQTVQIADLDAGFYNFVDFATPVPVAGDFWVGFEVNYGTEDTLVIFTAEHRPGGPNTTMVDFQGDWTGTDVVFGGDLMTSLGFEVLLSAGGPTMADFTQSATEICVGQSVEVDASSSANTTDYYWFMDDANPDFSSNIQEEFTFDTPGDYEIVLYTEGGCYLDSMITDIIVSEGVTGAVDVELASCGVNDGSLSINAQGGDGNYQYSIDGGNTFQASSEFTNLPSGTYDIIVVDDSGCGEHNETVSIGNADGPEITAVNVTELICDNCEGEIVVDAVDATEYSIDGGNTFQANNEFTGLCAGTYNIVIDDGTGCQNNDNAIIDAVDGVSFSVNQSDAACGEGGAISVNAQGGDGNYLYSIDGGDNFVTDADFTDLPEGDYDVIVQDGSGCQSNVNSVSISEVNDLTISLSASKTEACEGDEITLSASGANDYEWSDGAGVIGNGATLTTTVTNTTTYTVDASSGDCDANESVTVEVLPTPVSTITPEYAEVCAGEEVTLTAGGGTDYYWQTGEQTESVVVSPTSQMSYSVVASNGVCEGDAATAIISVLPTPTAVAGAQSTSVYLSQGGEAHFTSTGTIGSDLIWDFGNGATSTNPNPSHTYTQVGTYEVTLTVFFDNGCSHTDTITITVEAVVSVEENELENQVNLFPNPISSGMLTISFNLSTSEDVQLRVFNSLGQLIHGEQINGVQQTNYEVDVNNYASGIYYVNMQIGNEQLVKKISVQK